MLVANPRTFYMSVDSPTIAAHEVGHTFDWRDASFWRVAGANPIATEGELIEYGDRFDIMRDANSYSVETASEVELRIYDMLGQTVRTLVQGMKPVGDYSVVWDGRDDFGQKMPSGHYFYRFKAGEMQATRAMILLK